MKNKRDSAFLQLRLTGYTPRAARFILDQYTDCWADFLKEPQGYITSFNEGVQHNRWKDPGENK